MTWFKRDTEIHWFHPDEQEAIIQLITEEVSR
jgi:tRNA dimethylallyltransferase